MNHKRYVSQCMLALTISIFFTAYTLSGCAPLKKKFSRKKAVNKEEEIIPILEPEEYAAASDSPEAIYKQAYSLWKVWHRELMDKLEDPQSMNDKNIRRLFEEDIKQLVKMRDLLQENSRTGIDSVIEDIKSASTEFERPSEMRNYQIIKRTLRDIDKKVRKECSPNSSIEIVNKA